MSEFNIEVMMITTISTDTRPEGGREGVSEEIKIPVSPPLCLLSVYFAPIAE